MLNIWVVEIKSQRKLLSFEDATNHKPSMNEEGDKQTIMGAHHMETLAKRSTMVLHRHAAVEVMGDDGAYIAQRQMATRCLLHDTDAPVDIG